MHHIVAGSSIKKIYNRTFLYNLQLENKHFLPEFKILFNLILPYCDDQVPV
jgi:hypothetical protein